MRTIILPLFFFFSAFSFSQIVTDDFSDGDFTQNPEWTGNTADFIVNTESQLQLNASVAGTSYLSTASPGSSMDDMEWQFYIRLNFSPSNNNLARVYLASDQQDLTGSLNGYYLRFGENGSLDAIELYRQTGTTSTLVLRGSDGLIANAFAIRVKVTRQTGGQWSLFVDNNAGFNFIPEATGTDNTHTSSSRFGVYALYTATNINRFYFDDFYVGPVIVDTDPPEVLSVKAVSNNQVQVVFNEGVEITSAENTNNYSVNNGIGNPSTAVRNSQNPSVVTLSFTNVLQDGINNTITISNIKDFSDNIMQAPASHNFYYYIIKSYDVVFSELMANPTPPVGLPDHEYIELYNTTPFPINVNNWVLTHGVTNRVLPNAVILPDSFLVLTTVAAFPSLQTFGNVVAVTGLSATALTNSGATLILKNDSGKVIHAVSYSDTWYQDSPKQNGGWSLELIDPSNPCAGISNWRASKDVSGGTPGRRNSVNASNPDMAPPEITGICVVSDVQLQVNFSETIDTSGLNASGIMIDNGVGNPVGITFDGPLVRSMQLYFNTPLQKNLNYNLTVNGNVSDCAGNTMAATPVPFSLYEAGAHDVVINELMVKPDPVVGLPNHEYIELYNRSQFPVNLKDWTITIGNSTRSFPCSSILPGEYAIVTNTSSGTAFNNYGKVIGVDALPALPNSSGTIIIKNGSGEIITTVSYTDDWYKSNNKKNGGWSLEQIDPSNPCAGISNWKASNSLEGGTPGKINSVNAGNPDNENPDLVRVALIDDYTIRAFFNEPLFKASLGETTIYTVDNGIGNPINVSPVEPEYSSVTLSFSSPFQYGVYYTLSVDGMIEDCAGNTVASGSKARFAIPDDISPKDIIINEILFNPRDGGVRFVEVFNRSPRILDLKDLRLSSIDLVSGELTSVNTIDNTGYLIFPEDYVVLTTKPDVVKEHYYTSNPKAFAKMSSLPTFANSSGRAVLSLVNETIIDRLDYTQEMHFPLLNSFKGVSLERIDPERPTEDKSNWMSASENTGFATPGDRNSQYKASEPGEDEITIEPQIFSPDNDGFNDVVNIIYKFDDPGYVASITVFDSGGRIVRYLARSELLGTEGVYTWDGINEAREKSSIGIYIIFFEVFDLNGNVKKFKKTCVLGGRI